jgi:hypothetical protein
MLILLLGVWDFVAVSPLDIQEFPEMHLGSHSIQHRSARNAQSEQMNRDYE